MSDPIQLGPKAEFVDYESGFGCIGCPKSTENFHEVATKAILTTQPDGSKIFYACCSETCRDRLLATATYWGKQQAVSGQDPNPAKPDPCGDCSSTTSYSDLRDPSWRKTCKCGLSLCEPCADAHSNYECRWQASPLQVLEAATAAKISSALEKARDEERDLIVQYLGKAALEFEKDGDSDGFATCAAMAHQIRDGAHRE